MNRGPIGTHQEEGSFANMWHCRAELLNFACSSRPRGMGFRSFDGPPTPIITVYTVARPKNFLSPIQAFRVARPQALLEKLPTCGSPGRIRVLSLDLQDK